LNGTALVKIVTFSLNDLSLNQPLMQTKLTQKYSGSNPNNNQQQTKSSSSQCQCARNAPKTF